MADQADTKDPGAASSGASQSTSFEVKVDRAIAAAVSAGPGSKAEGNVTVQTIHAENVYLVASGEAASPPALVTAKATTETAAPPGLLRRLFQKQPRIIIQRTTTAVPRPTELSGDLTFQYRGATCSGLLSYSAFYIENVGVVPVPPGTVHVTPNKLSKLMGCRAVGHAQGFAGSVECAEDLSSNTLLLHHGTLNPDERLLWGIVLCGPSDLEYRYVGSPGVSAREKAWPSDGPSWAPLLIFAIAGSAVAIPIATSITMVASALGILVVALAVSFWRAKLWLRRFERGSPLRLQSQAAHIQITSPAVAPATTATASTGATAGATEHQKKPTTEVSISPARLRARKELDQLASEYELLRTSTDPERERRLDNIENKVRYSAYQLDADDLMWLFETGEHAKVVFAIILASGMRDAKAFGVVLSVLRSPETQYVQWLALKAACDLVTKLDAKLDQKQLAELRSAVKSQMAEAAKFPITHAEAQQWRLCQQLLAATDTASEGNQGTSATP